MLSEYRAETAIFALLCVLALNYRRLGIPAGLEAVRAFLSNHHLPRMSRPVRIVTQITASIIVCLLGTFVVFRTLLKPALAQALASGNVVETEWLLNCGAKTNENYTTPDGEYTPLMIAADGGNATMVRVLLGHGAKINGKNLTGQSVLMTSCHRGNSEIVRLLIERGADVNAADTDHNHVIHYAVSGPGLFRPGAPYDKTNKLTLLLSAGADVNQKGEAGATPLMYAAQNAELENVRFLIEHGANSNIRDDGGQSALDYSSESDRTELADILKKSGAK